MPKAFDDMVTAIKKSLRQSHPGWSEDKVSSSAYAIATDRWKKSHGGKPPRRGEKIKDWHILEFFVPIEEVYPNETDDFIIKGTAINETTTLNNVKYVADELEKAAPTFAGKKIFLDHKNEVLNIVGIVTGSYFNPMKRSIEFEGKIMEKKIQEMIKDGRISNVSIGARVKDLIDEEDGSKKAIGILGLELSLVGIPGYSNADFGQAVQHGLYLKEMAMLDEEIDKAKLPIKEKQINKKSYSPASAGKIQLNIILGG